MDYPFDLARFIEAQRGSYDQALAELTAGEKRSRWMGPGERMVENVR